MKAVKAQHAGQKAVKSAKLKGKSVGMKKPVSDVIKTVGANGQISLGKFYAGKTVSISISEDNIVTIRPGQFIPDNEKWLYEGDNLKELHEAIEWAENSERKDNFHEVMAEFERKWEKE